MFPPVNPNLGDDRRRALAQKLSQMSMRRGFGGLPMFGGMRPLPGYRLPNPNFTFNSHVPDFVTDKLGAAIPRNDPWNSSPGPGIPALGPGPGNPGNPLFGGPVGPVMAPAPVFGPDPIFMPPPSPGGAPGGRIDDPQFGAPIPPAPINPPFTGMVPVGGGGFVDPITGLVVNPAAPPPLGGAVSGFTGGGRAV